jgi:hypothetical protein
MCEAFLMHVGSALEVIKIKGYFETHEDSNKAYVEQRNLVRQAKAHLAKLDGDRIFQEVHQEAQGNCCCGQPS